MDNQPPICVSPDGHDVAIRNGSDDRYPWRVSNGGRYADHHVNDWLPLMLDGEAQDRPRGWSPNPAWQNHEAPIDRDSLTNRDAQ